MGSQMATVKDEEGNKHVIFDESSLYDDSQMGGQLDDFEFLQALNENHICPIAKVRSLINHKIYAIKKIGQNHIWNDDIMNKLAALSNPHILKYYKLLMDDYNNIYLIMEFMNNSDINGFIKAHRVLNKKIKEEEIWNILLQCSSALDYLHKQNLGNLGIEFSNILMSNEQNAKISVFINNNNNQIYDSKNDIYLLGKYFYILCFSQEPNLKNIPIEQIQVQKRESQFYSKELIDIIYNMLDEPNNRLDSNSLYNKIKKEYVKKYARNSSINSVLRCLYAYSNLNEIIFKKAEEFEDNKDKYYINYWYLKAIKALSGVEESNLTECIEEFRRAIAFENSKLDGNREIDPLYLLAFLLEKMHKELNHKEGNLNMPMTQSGSFTFESIFNGEEEDATNKEQMLYKFIKYFNSNVHSPISDLFFGFVKTKRNCQTCSTPNYSFSNFCFVVFDLSKNNNNEEFDLVTDGFRFQYDYAKPLEPDKLERVFCKRCMSYQKQFEFNRYYMLNHQLIISFIRGNKFQNYSNIVFEEILNLEDYVDEKDASPKEYYLVGSINRIIKNEKEEFVYFARDPDNFFYWHIGSEEGNYNQFEKNNEVLVLNNEPNNSIINYIRNKGQIIMLFYNNKDFLKNKFQ